LPVNRPELLILPPRRWIRALAIYRKSRTYRPRTRLINRLNLFASSVVKAWTDPSQKYPRTNKLSFIRLIRRDWGDDQAEFEHAAGGPVESQIAIPNRVRSMGLQITLGLPAVFIPIAAQHCMIIPRNLIDSGITRAMRFLVVAGQKKAVDPAVGNDQSHKRSSGRQSSSKEASRESSALARNILDIQV
jgi:hypothetical protein